MLKVGWSTKPDMADHALRIALFDYPGAWESALLGARDIFDYAHEQAKALGHQGFQANPS